MLTTLFAPPPRTADLQPEHACLIAALRRWVMAQRHEGRCPLQAAAAQLGCMQAARALHLLLAQVGAAWPDPVAIAPPCCAVLTHDEATILSLIVASRDHGRPVFDALLCEMLNEDARDRLFGAAERLGEVIGC